MDTFQKRSDRNGFWVSFDPRGDGNCFFSAAGFQLGQDGAKLKEATYKYLKKQQIDMSKSTTLLINILEIRLKSVYICSRAKLIGWFEAREIEREQLEVVSGILKTGTVLVICVKLRDRSKIIGRERGGHYLCREGHKFVEQNLGSVTIFYLYN